jgi:hypothetical protein
MVIVFPLIVSHTSWDATSPQSWAFCRQNRLRLVVQGQHGATGTGPALAPCSPVVCIPDVHCKLDVQPLPCCDPIAGPGEDQRPQSVSNSDRTRHPVQ